MIYHVTQNLEFFKRSQYELSILVISNHRILNIFLSNTLWSFLFVINTRMLLVHGESESFYILYTTNTFLCFSIYRHEKQYFFGQKIAVQHFFVFLTLHRNIYIMHIMQKCSNCYVNSWKCWYRWYFYLFISFHFIHWQYFTAEVTLYWNQNQSKMQIFLIFVRMENIEHSFKQAKSLFQLVV